mmetsp:Transcript_111442/g.320169  ORF Transcript_111442/g.320169 Transcript_111442/m.320169 type:complete len:373 (-) Transcript_111442:404-1522(-)
MDGRDEDRIQAPCEGARLEEPRALREVLPGEDGRRGSEARQLARRLVLGLRAWLYQGAWASSRRALGHLEGHGREPAHRCGHGYQPLVSPRACAEPRVEGGRPPCWQRRRRVADHARPPPCRPAGSEECARVGMEIQSEGQRGRRTQSPACVGLREEPIQAKCDARGAAVGVERHLGPHPRPCRRHPSHPADKELPRSRSAFQSIFARPAASGHGVLQMDLTQCKLQLCGSNASGREQLWPLLHQGLRRLHRRPLEVLAGGRPAGRQAGAAEGQPSGRHRLEEEPRALQRQLRPRRRGIPGRALLHRLLHRRLLRLGADRVHGGPRGARHACAGARRRPLRLAAQAPRILRSRAHAGEVQAHLLGVPHRVRG